MISYFKFKGLMDLLSETYIKTPLTGSPLLPFLFLSLARQKNAPRAVQSINREYDYIIVGGGTAGSVVAGRLSEVPCVSVLLLEAGPEPPLITEVPPLFPYLLGTSIDWNIKMVPQKHAAYAIKNRTLIFHGGKMLGGSSNINGMVYVRGNHKNYDDWAADGAKGWSFRDVFPYFLKLEDNKNCNFLRNGYHAFGGPITVESPRYVPELSHFFYEAATSLGYKYIDINAARQTGFSDYQTNFRDAQRCSTAKAYLAPIDDRPNLHILLSATVTKIIIKDGQAKGVKLYHKGRYRVVKARNEVILSAGTVNTPKLLMLSGVGPRKELEKLNIKVKADLPVGKNLQDHGYSFYFFTVDQEFGILKKLSDPSYIAEYINSRSGPLSSLNKPAAAFLKGLKIRTCKDFPNYEFYIQEVDKASQKKVLRPEVYEHLFGHIDDELAIYACSPNSLQPRSRGTVTLKSRNFFDSPAIDPNYLHDPKEVEDIVDGLEMCKRLLNSEPLQRVGVKPFEKLMPGCEIYANNERQYLSCYARHIFSPDWHLVGTAKMGDPKDLNTVVDPKLRVKNIANLRVVDASIMPIIPSGNTQTPTVMIAEKASDIIKDSVRCIKRRQHRLPFMCLNKNYVDTIFYRRNNKKKIEFFA